MFSREGSFLVCVEKFTLPACIQVNLKRNSMFSGYIIFLTNVLSMAFFFVDYKWPHVHLEYFIIERTFFCQENNVFCEYNEIFWVMLQMVYGITPQRFLSVLAAMIQRIICSEKQWKEQLWFIFVSSSHPKVKIWWYLPFHF